ncbi:hypothetical protein PRIPAC_89201 [Pristionchus pacificus]|nr:hypothetical protein PRIPAC_89201 [Pristionchus pacificus]
MILPIYLLLLACSSDSFKVLVYNSKFGHSHSNYMGRLADIIAGAGHDVTSLISVIHPAHADGTHNSTKLIVEQSPETKIVVDKFNGAQVDLFSSNNYDPIGGYMFGNLFGAIFATQCKAVLEEPGLIERLKSGKYDVLLAEHFDMCGLGLVEVIKPKSFISVSTSVVFGSQFEEYGIPNMPSFDPVFREKFGPHFPSFVDISSRSAYVFTNSEPLIDFAAPTITKVIKLGGLGTKEPNKLSKEWESILAKREKAILLSFGSVVLSSKLPIPVKHSIIEVGNLVLSKWTPQSDLLAHPKMAIFITHGGAGSTQETAGRGVPGIFVPLFGDQPRNAGMMQYNGLGKVLSKYDITTPAKVIAVIKGVLENERHDYRKNARKISAMLKKKPFGYNELIVKYVEFAAEFGPSPALRPQSFDMNWIEYNNVDIIVLGLITLSTIVCITTMTALRLIKLFLAKEKKKIE